METDAAEGRQLGSDRPNLPACLARFVDKFDPSYNYLAKFMFDYSSKTLAVHTTIIGSLLPSSVFQL